MKKQALTRIEIDALAPSTLTAPDERREPVSPDGRDYPSKPETRARAALRAPWMPIALLAVVSVLSLAARVAWLSDPCANPCKGPAAHSLIFDEVYYVNAARRIDGLAVPPKQPYAGDPAGHFLLREANSVPRTLRNASLLRRVALLSRGP